MVNRPRFVYFFCIFLTLYHLTARIGLSVDIQWHLDVGRDRMLTPPHVMILAGFPFCILFSLYYLIINTKDYKSGKEISGFKMFGFIAPGSVWMILLGMVSIGIGAIYDDYWHAQFGIDTTVITPPHMFTLFGGMLAEFASVLLVRDLMEFDTKNQFNGKRVLAAILLWTLLLHGSFAFLNFIDPRAATISVFGFTTMLHLYFGPMVVIAILLIGNQWFDNKVIYILGGFTFAIQSAMFVLIPIAVDVLMGPSHAYRPGAPNVVWAAHCVPYLFILVAFIFAKFDLANRPNLLVMIALLSDVIFSPFLPVNYPSEVGFLITMVNLAGAFLLLRLSIPLLQRYYARILSSLDSGIIDFRPKIKSVAVLLVLLFISPVSAHNNNFEEGSGFDAPMRIEVDIDGIEVWVEFMLWPPKAPQSCEILLVAEDNESRIDSMWTEIVFLDDNGEVRMIQKFEQYPDQSIWFGENYFTFSGNQTLEIKASIDGEEFTDHISLEVDPPASIPVWLAWTLSSIWVFAIYAIPYLAAGMRRTLECEE